jgi:hypothetical protein
MGTVRFSETVVAIYTRPRGVTILNYNGIDIFTAVKTQISL